MSDLNIYNSEYGPITWYKRRPVYLTAFIIAGFVLGMFATVFITAGKGDPMAFAFSPPEFWRGFRFWQLFTYPLLAAPTLFFAFSMLVFYWTGVQVERYLGRPRFVRMLILLALVSPGLQTIFWLAGLPYMTSVGANELIFGTFIACATLYPGMDYFWGIPMKWLAIGGVVLYSMLHIMQRDMLGLIQLLACSAAAYGYVRYFQKGGEMPEWAEKFLGIFKPKPKFRVVRADEAGGDLHESIDPLLDKISKSGIGSLTSKEKEQLQRARKSLLKRQE